MGIGSTGCALCFRSWFPLAGLLSLVPLVGIYVYLDVWLLGQWRSLLLQRWTAGEIELSCFRDAISAVPSLPASTVRSMLETLPAGGDILAELKISAPTRTAIAEVVSTIHTCRATRLALNTTGWTLLLVILPLAALMRDWLYLAASGFLIFLQLFWRYQKAHYVKGLTKRLQSATWRHDFCRNTFDEIVGTFSWVPFSSADRDQVLIALP